MPARMTLNGYLDELASSSPAPGGGSVAALSGALGAALTAMVCRLTIGKKKYASVEEEMKNVLHQAEKLRIRFVDLQELDTAAFSKVMEAYSLPKETDPQKALRFSAVREAIKEATLVPLEVMKHCVDGLALTRQVASAGNGNSISDAGVAALMLHAAAEGAALNVRINLSTLNDSDFVGWKSGEMESLLQTCRKMLTETQGVVDGKIEGKKLPTK